MPNEIQPEKKEEKGELKEVNLLELLLEALKERRKQKRGALIEAMD